MESAIKEFLSERKEKFIKSRKKSNDVDKEAEERFLIENWVVGAAKRAKNISIVSHPSKFSHPAAKTSPILFEGVCRNDGYVRTGNVKTELVDANCPASSIDVYKFLNIVLSDELTVLEHLGMNSEKINNEFCLSGDEFRVVRDSFLSIQDAKSSDLETTALVSQVFFEVSSDKYHIISLLTPSTIVFEMKDRLNRIIFPDDKTKEIVKKKYKGEHSDHAFQSLNSVCVIGYGGSKPQNISVLNNAKSGKSYLLPSLPPKRKKYDLPLNDFFEESISKWFFEDSFYSFHELIAVDYNNKNIRVARDNVILYILRSVVSAAWKLRSSNVAGWSHRYEYSGLPKYQRIWLDKARTVERMNGDEWLDDVIESLSIWFLSSYSSVVKDHIEIDAEENIFHFKKLAKDNFEDAIR